MHARAQRPFCGSPGCCGGATPSRPSRSERKTRPWPSHPIVFRARSASVWTRGAACRWGDVSSRTKVCACIHAAAPSPPPPTSANASPTSRVVTVASALSAVPRHTSGTTAPPRASPPPTRPAYDSGAAGFVAFASAARTAASSMPIMPPWSGERIHAPKWCAITTCGSRASNASAKARSRLRGTSSSSRSRPRGSSPERPKDGVHSPSASASASASAPTAHGSHVPSLAGVSVESAVRSPRSRDAPSAIAA
eukprot:scaffold107488_cov30-Tisochrysis_lutea.AAC.3